MRQRSEEGFVGGLEAMLFGMLVFLAGTLLAAAAWATIDTKLAATAAAREAVRAYVEAPDAMAATAQARQAAATVLAGYGRATAGAEVRLVSGAFRRCGRVSLEVSVPAPLVVVPILGPLGRGARVGATHAEVVDPYRSGLPGAAACP